uniref:Alcohol dehydrogenase-like C-terminal domain-containing protein n=1 Tax=Meloidogyne floridensis TaxID=298350 RepID=A0A915P5M1_9BILA
VGSDVAEFKENDLIVPAISGIGTWCSHGIYDSKELFLVEGDVKDFIFLQILQLLIECLKTLNLSYGDIVVQNGANSSVGHFVIQICRILGVKTVNVVRDRPQIEILKNHLKKSGADEVYTEKEFSTLIRSKKLKAKLALNCVGGNSGMFLSRALEFGGTMVTYGGMSKIPVYVATSSVIFANTKSVGFWMSRWYGMRQNIELRNEERKNMYKELIGWYKNGELTLPKYQRKNLEEYKDAINQSTQPDPSSIKSKQIFTKKGNHHYFD